jgi:hypothetical protein
MDKGVRLAVIAADEAETLHRVEEFDGALALFAGQLTLRSAEAATALAGAFAWRGRTDDFHRLALDLEVGRRDAPAAVDQREVQRLTVGKVGKTRLLDRGNVDEYVLAAVIADDEAEALLRVEEFDDALALANDLRGHSAATATTAAKTAAASAAATEATATAAAVAAAATAAAIATATAAATIAEAATECRPVTEASAVESAAETLISTKTVALVTAATTAVTLTPSIETHAKIQTLKCPRIEEPTRWAHGATGRTRGNEPHAQRESLQENRRIS